MANYKGASGGFHDEAREAGSPLMGEALATLRRQISKKFERWDGRLDDFNGQTTRNNIVGDQHSGDQMLRTPDGPRHRRVPAMERHAMPRYEPHAYAEEFGGGYNRDMQSYRGYDRQPAYGQGRRDFGGRHRECKIQVDIPTFNGTFSIEEVLDWISEVERLFEYMEIPEGRKVKLASCGLKGGASAWWARVQARRLQSGDPLVQDWEVMKNMIRGNYLPPDYNHILSQQYQRYQQDNRTVPKTYVVRRLPLTPKEDDTTQGPLLFKTQCAMKGKVFEVIIDSGSWENLISRTVVNKIGIMIERHPNPYTIDWVKTAKKSQVTERCRATFSIGQYQDSSYFDIVEMDACGLLLGRPWQCDVAAQHDCQANIYKITKGGVKYMLYPKEDSPKSKITKKESKSLFTMTQSSGETETSMTDSKEVHAVVKWRMEVNKVGEKNIAPDEVKPLLSDFQDVMLDTLQRELPPLCVIPHRLDLILGANLPNLSYDRMNPKETGRSKDTNEESVEVELIQESPSSCAVLSLVTSTKGGIWRRMKKIHVEGRRIMKHLARVQFPANVHNKIKPKKYNVCRIVKKFNDNTYESDLLATKTISQISDVSNVYPFLLTDVLFSPDEPQSSRSSFFKERENDGGTLNNIRTRGRENTRGHKGSVRRRKMGKKLDQTRWGAHGRALGRRIPTPGRTGARAGAQVWDPGLFRKFLFSMLILRSFQISRFWTWVRYYLVWDIILFPSLILGNSFIFIS